jgi:hypothetical protein
MTTVANTRLGLCVRIATRKQIGRLCGVVLLLPVLAFFLFGCFFRAWDAFLLEFRYQYSEEIEVNKIMVAVLYLAVCGKRITLRKRRHHV